LVISGTGNNSAPFTVSLASPYTGFTLSAPGALDLSALTSGALAEVTLGASATSVILPTVAAGTRIELALKQGVAGSTVTWPSTVKWSGGAAPVLSTVVNYTDWLVLRMLQGGWIGAVVGAAIR
jgi:hypothetical protein